MGGHVGDLGGGLAGDTHAGADAVFQLADVADGRFAVADYGCGAEGRVDDADVGGGWWVVCGLRGCLRGAWRVRGGGGRSGVRLAGEVEGDVLFCDEAGADAGAEVLVEELGDFEGGDVFSGFEEAAGQDRDGVGVGLDQVGHYFGELDLVGEVGDGFFLPGEEGREGVDVVTVDLGDVRVGDDDEGEAAQCVDAVGEAGGEEGEGEVGGVKECGLGEGRAAMSR